MFADPRYVALAALGISFLIFIHELGHFLAARLFGVRVETFSIGFGPRLCGIRRGDTDYRISAVPLGGYVKMAGEYGDFGEEVPLAADDLMAKPIWQRAIIFSGGVLVNFAFAFVVFPIVFALGVPMLAPVVGAVEPGGAAWAAGIEPGDEFVEIGGTPVREFTDVRLGAALSDPGRGLHAVVRRDGALRDVVLRPTRNEAEGRWEVGVLPADGDELIVQPDTPAFERGLRTGDLLVAIGGRPVAGDPAGNTTIGALMSHGEPLEVTWRRAGVEHTALVPPAPSGHQQIGVRQATTSIVALRHHASPAPPSAESGALALAAGDVLLAVGGLPVASSDALRERLGQGGGAVPVSLLRDGERLDGPLVEAHRLALVGGDVAFGIDPAACRVDVRDDSPAAAAGLRDGDVILAVEEGDGACPHDDAGHDPDAAYDYGDLVALVTELEEPTTLTVCYHRPLEGRTGALAVRTEGGEIPGFHLAAREVVVQYGLGEAVAVGFAESVDSLRETWDTLVKLVTGDVAAKNLGGIVTISVAAYRIAAWDFSKLLFFLALLSINLGFINILPIPVLDGGQILFLLFEKIKGARLSDRFLNGAQLAGLVAVVALVLYVTYNDIMRLS